MTKTGTIWLNPAAAWAMWIEMWTAWCTTALMWWVPHPEAAQARAAGTGAPQARVCQPGGFTGDAAPGAIAGEEAEQSVNGRAFANGDAPWIEPSEGHAIELEAIPAADSLDEREQPLF